MNCVLQAQKLASQGAAPFKTPAEFANFVAETAPPEAKEHFKAQAAAMTKFSKGESVRLNKTCVLQKCTCSARHCTSPRVPARISLERLAIAADVVVIVVFK